jgi:hypothetical protein
VKATTLTAEALATAGLAKTPAHKATEARAMAITRDRALAREGVVVASIAVVLIAEGW